MRKSKQQTLKGFLRGAGFGLFVVFILAFTVACGGKSDGGGGSIAGSPGYGYNPGTGCVGCASGTGNYIGAGVGNSMYGDAQLTMEFYNDGNANVVVGQGRLHVFNGLQCSSGTYVPGGVYDLTTQTPGTLSNGIIDNVGLVDQSGSASRMVLSNARLFAATPKYLSCDGGHQYDELMATIYIESIAGYYCGSYVYVEMLNAPRVCN